MGGEIGLWSFADGSGTAIADSSGYSTPLPLTIEDPTAVSWTASGLRLDSSTTVSSSAATKITDAITTSDEFSAEVWISPANVTQDGPARVFGISNGGSTRNFTIGQGQWGTRPADTFYVRARSTTTSTNGEPALATAAGTATTALTHVVYARDTTGTTRVYLNGTQTATGTTAGDLSNWDNTMSVLIGNESTGDRPWLGTICLAAIHDRALTPTQITQNHAAGCPTTTGGGTGPTNQAPTVTATASPATDNGDGTWTITLTGTVNDDGLPNPPATTTQTWTPTQTPTGATTNITNPNNTSTTVTVNTPGTYQFQLTATDTNLTTTTTTPTNTTTATTTTQPATPYSTLEWVLTDHLGTTTTTINANGRTITHQTRNHPYGTPRTSTGTTNIDQTFTGQTNDPGTGLIDYNARQYDPQLARFTQADPLTLDGLDRYTYVRNNPLRYTDPSGLCSIISGDLWCSGVNMTFQEGLNAGLVADVNTETARRLENEWNTSAQRNSDGTWNVSNPAAMAPFDGPGLNITGAAGTVIRTFFFDYQCSGWGCGLEVALTFSPCKGPVKVACGRADEVAGGIIGRVRRTGDDAPNGTRGLSPLGGVIEQTGTNSAGGRIFTSTGSINQNDFAGIVNSGLTRGDDVHIFTGAHGFPNGSLVTDASLLADDVARFGDIPGVHIHDLPAMSPAQVREILDGPGTII